MLLSNARFVGVALFVPQINFEKLATMLLGHSMVDCAYSVLSMTQEVVNNGITHTHRQWCTSSGSRQQHFQFIHSRETGGLP